MPKTLIAVLFATALAATAAAQPFCSKCMNTGEVENPIAAKQLEELVEFGLDQEPVLHVSWYIDGDRKGRSLPTLPCQRCKAPEETAAARAEVERKAAEKEAWLERRLEIDRIVRPRGDLAHIETEHFRLTFGLRKVVLKSKRTLSTKQAALLYAKRLEDFYDWFQKYLAYDDEQARVVKHDIYLMADQRTLMTVAQHFCNLATDRAARAVGEPSILTTWVEPGVYSTDEDFHRHVLYHVSHLLLGVYYMKVWLVEHAGWLEEGIAHMCEMELFTMAGNTSSVERMDEDRSDADWEPEVRELISRKRTVSFAELIRKRADQLSGVEHQLAWSYTDYLYKVHGVDKIKALIHELKEKRDTAQLRDSLRDHFGLTVTGIDEQWEQWVVSNYRSKP